MRSDQNAGPAPKLFRFSMFLFSFADFGGHIKCCLELAQIMTSENMTSDFMKRFMISETISFGLVIEYLPG